METTIEQLTINLLCNIGIWEEIMEENRTQEAEAEFLLLCTEYHLFMKALGTVPIKTLKLKSRELFDVCTELVNNNNIKNLSLKIHKKEDVLIIAAALKSSSCTLESLSIGWEIAGVLELINSLKENKSVTKFKLTVSIFRKF